MLLEFNQQTTIEIVEIFMLEKSANINLKKSMIDEISIVLIRLSPDVSVSDR